VCGAWDDEQRGKGEEMGEVHGGGRAVEGWCEAEEVM
jgi:hypothetical protein